MNDGRFGDPRTVSTAPRRERSRTVGHTSLADFQRTLGEIVRILSLRRWAFFLPLCLVSTGVFVSSLRLPRRFVAHTVFSRHDDPVLVRLPRHSGFHAFQEAKAFRQSLFQHVTSPAATREVVRRLKFVEGSDAPDPTPDVQRKLRAMASRIASGLKVSTKHESNHLDIIEISYTSTERSSMTTILDEVRDYYIENAHEGIHRELVETRAWFESEARKRQPEIEALEDDLSRFRTEHRGVDPLDLGSVMSRLAVLNADMVNLERKKKDLDAQIEGRVEFLRGEGDVPAMVLTTNSGKGLESHSLPRTVDGKRLFDEVQRIEQQIGTAKTTRGMTEFHPHVVSLRLRQEELSSQLRWHEQRGEQDLLVNGVGQAQTVMDANAGEIGRQGIEEKRVENELRTLRQLQSNNDSEVARLASEIGEYEMIQGDALKNRREFLTRENAVNRARSGKALYHDYADTVERVLAAENSDRGILFDVIQPARASSVPATPRARTIMALAIFAGLATGILTVLLFELLDRTIRNTTQAARSLGSAVLGCVDEIVSSSVRRRRFIWRALVAPVMAFGLFGVVALSGSMAYLSIQNASTYNRMMRWPRSAVLHVQEAFRGAQAMVMHTDISETR